MKKPNGFSLFELLITISIAVIVLAFIVPSFDHIYQKSKQDVMQTQLLHAIQLARNEAVSRGVTVTLCQSKDQKTCSGFWQEGYIVADEAGVIFSFQNAKANDVLHWRAFPFYLVNLQYLPSGLPNFQNGTFWYCSAKESNPVWAIVMSQVGRVRLVYPDTSGKISVEKDKALEC